MLPVDDRQPHNGIFLMGTIHGIPIFAAGKNELICNVFFHHAARSCVICCPIALNAAET
jgi:hypothetical protein